MIDFVNNQNPPERTNWDYDRLWKIRKSFSCLNTYILHTIPPHRIYDSWWSNCEIQVYNGFLAVDTKKKTLILNNTVQALWYQRIHTWHGSVFRKTACERCFKYHTHPWNGSAANKESGSCLTQIIHGWLFFVPSTFFRPTQQEINSCSTVCHKRRGMPTKFWPKTLKMKTEKGESKHKCCALERKEGSVSPHQHAQPCTIGPFCGWRRKRLKTSVHRELRVWVLWIWMVAGSFSISYKMWKWPKKLSFCLVDLRILNAFIVHTSCGGHLCVVFQEQSAGSLTGATQDINSCPSTSRCGWPPSKEVHHFWLDFFFFFTMVQQPHWAKASLLLRIHGHTQTHHIW